MPEKYKSILEHTPFFISAAGSVKLNYTRIVETLVIVALTTLATTYMTVDRISYKMETMNKRMAAVEKTVDTLHPRGYPVPR